MEMAELLPLKAYLYILKSDNKNETLGYDGITFRKYTQQ